MQLRKYKIKIGKIHHIFISHVHGDHTFGLFGLISTFALLNRKTDLNIYAPEPLEKILLDHLESFDIYLPYKLVFHQLDCTGSQVLFEDEKVIIKTIPLKHRIPSSGFLFLEKQTLRNIRKDVIDKYKIPVKKIPGIKEGADFVTDSGEIIPNCDLTIEPRKPRSLAYCTDTLYNENILSQIAGVNLLYHEATFMHDMENQAKETYHSTSRQAAILAKKARVGILVLGHFSARYKNLDPLLEEARQVFQNSFLARDGESFFID